MIRPRFIIFMSRRFLLVCFCLAASACFRCGAAETHNVSLAKALVALGYEEVFLRRTDENKLFLFARVDGRKRSCLVDSGWSFTTISTNTAARLGESNLVRRLELGGVAFTNVGVRTQDLRVNGQPASFDIVLGADFLIANNAVLDFANRKLFLGRAPLSNKERSSLEDIFSAAKLSSVELEIRQPPVPVVSAQINGREIKLLVDSGATWSCLDSTIAQRINVKSLPSAHQISGVVAGKKSLRVASVDELKFNAETFSSGNFAVLSLEDWGFGSNGKLFSDIGGIVGGAELVSGGAVLDFGGKKLWLRTKP
jgi:hypothetical protein